MSSPWDVLGVDPASADARAVRRTYVRLIKVHRPDEDPKRFQEIRRAYEQAQALLAHHERTGTPLEELVVLQVDGSWVVLEGQVFDAGAATADDVDAEPETEDAEGSLEVQEAEAWDDEWSPAPDPPADLVQRLEQARAADDGDAVGEILRAERDAWCADPTGHAWFPFFAALAPDAYLAAAGDDDALADGLREAEQGTCVLAHALIPIWAVRGAWDRIAALGDGLAELCVGADAWEPGDCVPHALAACAAALALTDPERARRHVDTVHERVDFLYRDDVLCAADMALGLERELTALIPQDRERLARALYVEEERLDGAGKLAVHNAVSVLTEDSLGLAVLQERFPQVTKDAQRVHALSWARGVTDEPTTTGVIGYAIGALVLVVLLVVIVAYKRTRSTARPLPPPPPRPPIRVDRAFADLKSLREGQRPLDLRNLEMELPEIYDEHEWLKPLRRVIGLYLEFEPDRAWEEIRGERTVRSYDKRYPEMLRVFSLDMTLPADFRLACLGLLRGR